MKKFHSFHMVEMSPWPLLSSGGALGLTLSLVLWFNSQNLLFLSMGLLMLSVCSFNWWRDVSREANGEGLHFISVIDGLKMGMILFITSEVMFFFSFFWAYFQGSLSPNVEIGEKWPPMGVIPFDPMNIPLLNTLLLLSSGVSITLCHHLILENKFEESKKSLFITILLGGFFTLLQGFEYQESPFALSDSSYGSTFFVATGFHGLHVIIGSIFLLISFLFMNNISITYNHMVGFEAAAWYWHFVDVVWLFLYSAIYWWGS